MAKDSRVSTSPSPPAANPPEDDAQEAEVAAGSVEQAKTGDGEIIASDQKDEDNQEDGNERGSPADESGAGNDELKDSRKKGAKNEAATEGASTAKPARSNGTPAQSKKSKRKSSSGVPEHKSRKLNKKKSQMLTHLDAQPGDFYLARMKGHPPWPAVICSEDMLPPLILSSRPVAAKRPDGTYREDFADGGKKVNERSFPVMFLETNEFAWIINTELYDLPLDATEDPPKKSRKPNLDAAYKIAAEKHELAWFKKLLEEHQQAAEASEEEEEEPEEPEKAEPEAKKSKGKRKSKAAAQASDAEIEDVDMMDFEEEEVEVKKKSKSRKRKKGAESDGEGGKPAKTPKRGDSTKTAATPKLKLSNPKTPNGTSANKSASKASSAPKAAKAKGTSTKKSAKKSKDTTGDEEHSEEPEKVEEKRMSVGEQREKRQTELLFLRHKLQKGFLTRDQPPKEEEMKRMSDYITKLETYDELEVSIIRATKINKVLKAIVKLASIPKDEEFKFRQRSIDLLQNWNQLIAKEPETPVAGASTEENGTGINGVGKADKSDDEKAAKDDMDTEMAEKETSAVENEDEPETSKMDVDKPTSPIDELDADDSKVAEPAKEEEEVSTEKVETVTETVEAVESTA